MTSSTEEGGADVYASRQIHLVCIDKPGMGGSSFAYRFRIRRDWPRVVDMVARQLQLPDKYGVIGMSNGGPHAMATLTHPDLHHRVKAAAMVVGVSDVRASGYTTWRTPSTLFEGIYNSLPLVVTGPLNALALSMGSLYLFRFGGYESLLKNFSEEGKVPLRKLLSDGASNFGLGAALDCQQGLSPLFARSSSGEHGVDKNAIQAYQGIKVPVSLWYGTKDGTVPMSSAEWLQEQILDSTLHKLEAGHGLYFSHAEDILDELVKQMDRADHTAFATSRSD
jgi:pimeloyl-ACP methyl ester carboxylesterase